MEKIYLIYKATTPSNKSYIGITSRDLQQRRWEHESHARYPKRRHYFQKAILKYGDTITWEVIYSSKNLADIKNKEIYFIKYFNCNNPKYGYNHTIGGDGILGFKPTAEQNKANSERRKMYFQNPENKQRNIELLARVRAETPNFAKMGAKALWSKMNAEQRSAYIKKHRGVTAGKAKIKVRLIHKKTNKILIFDSISSAAKYMDCSISAISHVINGKAKSLRNYMCERI